MTSPHPAHAFVLGALVLLAAASCTRGETAPSSAQGRELFAGACARCHGQDGAGGFPASPGAPSPRNFRDHGFHASHSDEQIKQTIVSGKGAAMPPFGTMFDDAQLRALVAQVRSFDPERR